MLVVLDMIVFEVQSICVGLMFTLLAGYANERW